MPRTALITMWTQLPRLIFILGNYNVRVICVIILMGILRSLKEINISSNHLIHHEIKTRRDIKRFGLVLYRLSSLPLIQGKTTLCSISCQPIIQAIAPTTLIGSKPNIRTQMDGTDRYANVMKQTPDRSLKNSVLSNLHQLHGFNSQPLGDFSEMPARLCLAIRTQSYVDRADFVLARISVSVSFAVSGFLFHGFSHRN